MSKNQEYSIECNINLHKRVFGIKFKNRATTCIREIKKFAQKVMGSANIRVDTELNRYIWSKGPRCSPIGIRVRLVKKRCVSENFDDWIIFISRVNNFKSVNTVKKK